MFEINWTAISSIVSSIMVLIALISLCQNRKQLHLLEKQREEDLRAKLVLEIISWQNLFLLKISNIGKETAYNIKIDIEGELIDNHFSNNIKDEFKSLSNNIFNMVVGHSLYYYISPVYSENSALHNIGGNESFNGKEINKWLNKYKDSSIHISGRYCDKYIINEDFSISKFITGKSIIVESSSSRALQEISKGLSCKNDSHRSIQENIDDIATSLEQIKKYIKQK